MTSLHVHFTSTHCLQRPAINQAYSREGVKTQELKIWLIDVHIHIDLEEHAAL